jgi:hypothetical protein
MRATILPAAALLLAVGAGAAPPVSAQQAGTDRQQQGPDEAGAPTLGSPAVPTATQGGVQGNCPAGQVASANSQCAPGQPEAAGGTGSGQMPASPHQQELLKGQQGSESAPK